MSLNTVVTLGFSISGGLTAGTATLPTLGYGIGSGVVPGVGPFCFTLTHVTSGGATLTEVEAGGSDIEHVTAGGATLTEVECK